MNKKVTGLASFAVLASSIIPLSGKALYCDASQNKMNLAYGLVTEEEKTLNVSQVLMEETNYEKLKEELGIKAESAYLIEANTGKVLFSHNANKKLAPASMTKIMTLLIIMEEIESGKIHLNDGVTISENAAAAEGSECFLDAGETYLVKDLIKSIMVASANDSAVALSEYSSGSEELFAAKMNKRAKELGMKNTNFKNATGLDTEGHHTTAEDISIAIKELSKYEHLLGNHKVWMYDMIHPSGRKTGLTNTNRLVRTEKDMVLAKTGHTDNAGYCITTLSKRGDTTIIASVFGLQDSKERFNEAKKLTDYAFSNFETIKVVDSNEPEKVVKVKGTQNPEITLLPEHDVFITHPKGEGITSLREVVEERENLTAPIAKGEPLAKLKVTLSTGEEEMVNLVASENVEKITYGEITKKVIEKAKMS